MRSGRRSVHDGARLIYRVHGSPLARAERPYRGDMDRPLSRPTRRQAIGAIGAGAAAAWAAPTILSVDAARAATVPPTLNLTAVAGRNSDFVVTSDDGRAYRSLDAGLNWSANTAPPPPPGADLVVAANSGTNDFQIATAAGAVWYTINAAFSWSAAGSPPAITGVVAAAGTNGTTVLVSGTGDAWFSFDDGDTWTQASSPPSSLVTGLSASDDGGTPLFMTVASDGSVFQSSDGDVWTPVVPPPGGPSFVAVTASGNDVCAVAGTDIVYHWSPGFGWDVITTALSGLTVVAGDGDDDFVAVGAGGAMIRDTNGGRFWNESVDTPPLFIATAIAGDVFGHYVAIGPGGAVSRSLDYGNTWQNPDTPPA